MKTFARALLVLALFVPTLASAQANAESRAEAAKLLDAVDMQATLDKLIAVTIDAQVTGKPEMEPYRGVLTDFFHKYMSYESMKPDLVEIYAENFTAKELAEIRAFYESPTGHKAMLVMPGMMQKGGEMGRKRVEAHMAELVKMIQDQKERLDAQATQNGKVSETDATPPASTPVAAPAQPKKP